jgi:hypothetical protein
MSMTPLPVLNSDCPILEHSQLANTKFGWDLMIGVRTREVFLGDGDDAGESEEDDTVGSESL